MASQHGHAELAQRLCGARADIDKQFNDGTTPLLMASQHGHASFLRQPGKGTEMPIMGGHAELAQLLCGARADIDKPDENCATALAWASRFGYTKVAQLLCRAKLHVVPFSGSTATTTA